MSSRPTNGVIYLGYVDNSVSPPTTNFFSAINNLTPTNTAEAFNSGSLLGADPQGTTGRAFIGLMSDVALYNTSLSQDAILGLFLTSLGSGPLAPTPAALASKAVFSGAQVVMNGHASGSPTITYQWKSSVTGASAFTNVPDSGNYSGATTETLTINNIGGQNALDYEVVAANGVGSATTIVPATITVVAIPAGGQWTVNFQLTNDVLNFGSTPAGAGGLGHYAGHGVLGSGTFWNPIPDLAGAFSGATYHSISDLRDDGVTHSGISATVNGGGFGSASTAGSPAAITTLFDQ